MPSYDEWPFLDPTTPQGEEFERVLKEAIHQLLNNEGPWKKAVQVCKHCKLQNEYAIPNQSDGSYICYNCK